MEKSNMTEKENFYNDFDSNNPSSIREFPEEDYSSFSRIIKESHYLCRNCHYFPRLFIKNKENKIIVIINCEDSEKEERSLEEYMKFKITEGNIDEYMNCICCNNQSSKYFCTDGKTNMCEDCYKKHNQRDNFKTFEYLDNEIKKEEEFIKGIIAYNHKNLEKINEKNTVQDFDNYSKNKNENKNENIINSNVIKLVKIDESHLGKVVIESQKQKFEKFINSYEFKLNDLIEIIYKDKKNYPNYIHYENILNIYYFFCEKIGIEYNFENYKNNNDNKTEIKIRIFGKSFVKNNKDKCIIFIDNKKEKLKEFIDIKKDNIMKKINIILVKLEDITDMSGMFSECEFLSSLNEEEPNWKTDNVTNMSKMFSGCKNLQNFSIISKWNTSKVTDMSNLFYNCETLQCLPDISKWKTNNVKDMNCIFEGCIALEYLPEISKWDLSNVNSINSMFKNCKSLKSLPDISKWNTSKINNMANLFQNCSGLKTLRDISEWDLRKVTTLRSMFEGCTSLEQLPEINKWEIDNVQYLNYMFCNCSKLQSLPDISQWNVNNVSYMNSMFENCSELKCLPDISCWELKKTVNKDNIIKGCNSLTNIPDFLLN